MEKWQTFNSFEEAADYCKGLILLQYKASMGEDFDGNGKSLNTWSVRYEED